MRYFSLEWNLRTSWSGCRAESEKLLHPVGLIRGQPLDETGQGEKREFAHGRFGHRGFLNRLQHSVQTCIGLDGADDSVSRSLT